ncbi:hypothetical protein ACFYY6_37685, partial [Streptomyces sp. NPDC001750]
LAHNLTSARSPPTTTPTTDLAISHGKHRCSTRALNAALAAVPAQRSWSWPLDRRNFDRRPELRVQEEEALDALGWEVRRRHGHNPHVPQWRVIRRLVTPLEEARECLGWLPDLVHHRRAVDDAAALVLRTCTMENQAYWGWTPDVWARLIATDAPSFTAPWPSWLERFTRPYVIALAYLVGGSVDFHRIGSYSRPSVARRVFGDHALEAAVAEVTEVLTGWGYRSNEGSRHGLRRVLCEVLLLNRSPLLSDLSGETLLQMREGARAEQVEPRCPARYPPGRGGTRLRGSATGTQADEGRRENRRRRRILDLVGRAVGQYVTPDAQGLWHLPDHLGQSRAVAGRRAS